MIIKTKGQDEVQILQYKADETTAATLEKEIVGPIRAIADTLPATKAKEIPLEKIEDMRAAAREVKARIQK